MTRIGTWEVTVREGTAARLAAGVGGQPTTAVTPALAGNLGVGYSFRVLPRNILHSAQTIDIAATAEVSDTLRVRGHIARVARRGTRAYVTVAAEITTRHRLVWRITTESFVPDMPAAHLEEAVDRPPAIPDLPVTAADSWIPSIDEMTAFSGAGNFHSDRDVARSFGYPRPVVQGMHVAARAMAVFPGIADVGRELRIWFTGMTLEGDELTFGLRAGTADWVSATGADGGQRMLLVSREATTAP